MKSNWIYLVYCQGLDLEMKQEYYKDKFKLHVKKYIQTEFYTDKFLCAWFCPRT